MEAKVIDFKQPMENHLGKNNKNQELKTKDFYETLSSVNKKTETKFENPSKPDEKKLKTSKDYYEKPVEEVVEKLVEDDKALYEGMINLLNIKSQIEDTDVTLEEVELVLVEIKPVILGTEEKLVNTNEVILDDEKNIENLPKEILEKLEIDDLKFESKEPMKSELVSQNTPKKEVGLETNKLESEATLNEDKKTINLNQVVSEEASDEFKNQDNKENTKSDSRYELVKSSDGNENQEIKNEAFTPFIKEGIEFTTDVPTEVEIPVIEPKEVVKQIVDQIKFDLSESKNEMKLTLKPETLGEMTMNIEVAKDGIIAKIMVDNYRTKEIIEGNIAQLKEGIKDTGMEIKTFEVFVGSGSDFDQHNFNGSNQFNLKQSSKKLRIKSEDNKVIKGYEDGIMEDRKKPLNYSREGGLNLFA